MADSPPRCQLDLVYACCLHFRFLSLRPVQLRHNEGVEGKYYQGNTGVSETDGTLPRLILNREVPRKRRFTYEYEGVLARCGAYFERVCRRVLSLRHFGIKPGTPIPADFPPLVAISVLNSVLFEPMMRVASSATSTRCAKALTCSRRYSRIYPEDWRSPPPASKTFIELDLVATNRTVCSEQNHAAGFGISAKPIEICG